MTHPPMQPSEWRWWHGGPARKMVEAEGYIMARRKGCMPFVVGRREWEALPPCEPPVRVRRVRVTEVSDEAAREGK